MKIGQKLKVINTMGHCFPVGTNVVLRDIRLNMVDGLPANTWYDVEGTGPYDNPLRQYLLAEDFEPIES